MLVLPVIPFPAIDPVLIAIGPFAVRWYALAYIVGIIGGWFYALVVGLVYGSITSPLLMFLGKSLICSDSDHGSSDTIFTSFGQS